MPSESWGGHASGPIPRKSRGRSSEARRLTRLPLHPVLFAAYAVLFLYAQNLTEVLLVDIGAPLARAVVGATTALVLLALLYRSPERGADSVVWAASSPELEGVTGGYFHDRRPKRSSERSHDEATAKRLWQVSEELVGISG